MKVKCKKIKKDELILFRIVPSSEEEIEILIDFSKIYIIFNKLEDLIFNKYYCNK
jgi:hypothetical protein